MMISSTAATIASLPDESDDDEFLDFVKRVQARREDGCVIKEQQQQPHRSYLDLYAGNVKEYESTNDKKSSNKNILTVRMFLHLEAIDEDSLTSLLPLWLEQVQALPATPWKRRKLNLHVLLTRRDRGEEEESEVDDCNNQQQQVSTLAKFLREILESVTGIRDAKIFLYARDDIRERGDPDNHKEVADSRISFQASPEISSIERIHIVLIKSLNFTSFHPAANDRNNGVPQVVHHLMHQLLSLLHASLPSLKQVTIECDKRQCWGNVSNRSLYYSSSSAPPCLPSSWLDRLLCSDQQQQHEPMYVTIRGWTLTMSVMQVLCRVLRATSLEGLTLSACRWDKSCRSCESPMLSQNKIDYCEHQTSPIDLVSALANNTTLKELHLNLGCIPPQVFCWDRLASAFGVQPTLTSFQITVCMKEEAFKSLLQAYQCSRTLQEIRIPFFFGTWTDSLLEQFRDILFSKGYRKVNFSLQHVPARWSNDPAPLHRRQVWALFKEYLFCSQASHALRVLQMSHLTPDELSELAVVLQNRPKQSRLESLRFKGSISLTALVALVECLGRDEMSRIIPTHLEVELWAGDEIHATKLLTQLGQAMKGHFGIMTLDISCAEYSAAPNANLLKDVYKDTDAAVTIESMLALNKAGRRRLLDNPYCLVAGTTVLAQVAHHQLVDAIFHHIVEHSSLVVGSNVPA
jgi:hypothetical protein